MSTRYAAAVARLEQVFDDDDPATVSRDDVAQGLALSSAFTLDEVAALEAVDMEFFQRTPASGSAVAALPRPGEQVGTGSVGPIAFRVETHTEIIELQRSRDTSNLDTHQLILRREARGAPQLEPGQVVLGPTASGPNQVTFRKTGHPLSDFFGRLELRPQLRVR